MSATPSEFEISEFIVYLDGLSAEAIQSLHAKTKDETMKTIAKFKAINKKIKDLERETKKKDKKQKDDDRVREEGSEED